MPNHQGFDYFFGTPTSNDGLSTSTGTKTRRSKGDMATLTRRYTDEVIAFIEKNAATVLRLPPLHHGPHQLDASPDFNGKSPRGLYGDVIEEIDFNAAGSSTP